MDGNKYPAMGKISYLRFKFICALKQHFFLSRISLAFGQILNKMMRELCEWGESEWCCLIAPHWNRNSNFSIMILRAHVWNGLFGEGWLVLIGLADAMRNPMRASTSMFCLFTLHRSISFNLCHGSIPRGIATRQRQTQNMFIYLIYKWASNQTHFFHKYYFLPFAGPALLRRSTFM